jgi:hypothetical protein
MIEAGDRVASSWTYARIGRSEFAMAVTGGAAAGPFIALFARGVALDEISAFGRGWRHKPTASRAAVAVHVVTVVAGLTISGRQDTITTDATADFEVDVTDTVRIGDAGELASAGREADASDSWRQRWVVGIFRKVSGLKVHDGLKVVRPSPVNKEG